MTICQCCFSFIASVFLTGWKSISGQNLSLTYYCWKFRTVGWRLFWDPTTGCQWSKNPGSLQTTDSKVNFQPEGLNLLWFLLCERVGHHTEKCIDHHGIFCGFLEEYAARGQKLGYKFCRKKSFLSKCLLLVALVASANVKQHCINIPHT